ncbi:hypothetical protein Tco_0630588 [Tanacetum coccineum]
MRMEQYLTHTDFALWEVILNGDAPAIASASDGTEVNNWTMKIRSRFILMILKDESLMVGGNALPMRAPRNQGNRNGDGPRRNAPVDTSTTNALVVQDGIGGYD